MRAPRCALLLLLLQCVSSLPVSHTHLDNEDVKVVKCIVEVLADALSQPQSLPVSQKCLETLRTDDRLVTILRHQNFLQELQDIAGKGANEGSEKGTEEISDHAQDLHEPPDQSMLMAFLTPGETVKERRAEEEEEKKEQKPQKNEIITSPKEMNKGDEKVERVVMKKTENIEEEEEDEAGGAGAPEHKRVEHEKEHEKEHEEEHEEEQGEESVERSKTGVGKQKHWSHGREPVHRRAYGQQEAPHHSKEVWKSPEEEELQMMAGRDTEEGSATKRTEDAEMESLAVMENELENMAQKLHRLRHG
ncbi:chromogranin-A isoform 2-T2 [Clarias gariepinus]|uniref:chromogranin-A isoform X2 n=1 Tax=Clarias gariepinus TaxID=13013 RepID=UPI00234C57FD|nr:chromogranin-A isoform X2 [Clarias gariepinus]